MKKSLSTRRRVPLFCLLLASLAAASIAPARAQAPSPSVCDRTAQVRAEILKQVGKTCSQVTAEDLAGISGTLNLAVESITALQSGDFNGLVNVTNLTLLGNQLTTLPANAFAGLDKLTGLVLSLNQLTSLPANVFAGLGKLTDLDLDSNRLTTLPENAFAGLGELTSLSLDNNRLTTLPANAFAGLDKLTGLVLSLNQLTSLPANVFAGLDKLTRLELWNNRLTSLPANAFAGLDKLTELRLDNNELTTLPANAFAGLDKLTGLVLSGNRLTTLPENAFAGLGDLDRLFLDNNKLTTLSANVFAGLDKLITLRLNENRLTTLPANAFAGLDKLITLRLNENRLATLSANVFAGLDKLDLLDLDNNRLTTLPENAFAGLGDLGILYLSNNDLTTLPANVFSGMGELSELWLDGNSLTTLPANVFAGLGKLTRLELWNNRLTTLPANAFAGLDKLSWLDLDDNPLTTLSANAFSGLGKLDRLYLQNHRLTTLPANAFAGLGNLDRLDLRSNLLTTLSVGAFNGLTPGVVAISGIGKLPSPPAALSFTPRNRALRVQWDAAANTHYQLRWKAAAARTFAADDAAATSSYSHTITGLQNDVEYEVQVAAVPAAPTNTSSRTRHRWSSRSGRATPASAVPVPGAPQTPAVTPGNGELAVTWAAPAADGGDAVATYRLRWKAADETEFADADAATVDAPALTATITGLSNGRTYDVEIAAGNSAGFGDAATAQGTPRTVPGAPQTPAATPGNGELAVTWAAPAADGGDAVATYRLRWKAADETEFADADAATVDAPALTAAITGLSNGRTYDVEIAAGNSAGFGDAATTQGTPRTVPGAPQTPAATPGNGELAVTWAAPAADGGDAVATYRLRWKAADETEFADADAATVDAPALTATITGLSNGRTYDVEIAAGNSAGFGDAATAQGTPRTVPGAQAPSPSVCDRTAQVRAAIVKRVGGGKTCSQVTAQDLAGISGTLDLRYKSITALESGDFNGLVNVTTLWLTNNHLTTLPANAFAGLGKLTSLYLSSNRLTTLPANAFAGLDKLTGLGLSNNQLTTLSANAFAGLANVTRLWLTNNHLTTLPANAFAGLANVTGLWLTNNRLTTLPAGAFNGLTPGVVRISGIAGLPSPPAALRFTPRNQALQVRWDAAANTHYQLRWKAAAATTFAADDAAATSSGSHTITGLQNGAEYEVQVAAVPAAPTNTNSATTHLWESRNGSATPSWNLRLEPRFESLRATWDAPASGSADSYKIRWKAVGTSQYSEAAPATTAYTITGLQNGATYEVQVAAVDGDFTGEFGAAAQAAPSAVWPSPSVCDRTAQVRAEILKRVGGGKTCGTVTADDLAGISGRLDLRNKSITALQSGDFNGLVNVTTLTLLRNQLTTLPANVFAGLGKLTNLVLDSNRLTTLPENVFAGLGKLTELDLGDNQLTTLPENVFAGLGKLTRLFLDNNRLTSLPANAFAGLGELTELILWNNHLDTLPENVFAGLGKLTYLVLGNNRLTTLPANVFAGLGKLRSLRLYNNPQLTTLPVGAFNGLTPGLVRISGIAGLPSPPAALRFTPRNQALQVRWNAAANTHYQLRWKAAAATTFAADDAAATSSYSHTITGLQNGAEYEVQVAAVPAAPTNTDSLSLVAWESRSGSATLAAPGMPRNLRLEPRIESLRATWNAPASGSADSYKIRWKAVGTSQYAETAPQTTTYTITGLQNATTYEVQVAAVDGDFTGEFGAAARAAPSKWPVCERTAQVRAEIVKRVGGGKTCATVTAQDLAGISGRLDLRNKSITALQSGDFNGLVNVTELWMHDNPLTTLPANAFAGLNKLTGLYLLRNQLTTLSANAFAGLGKLTELSMSSNQLTMLPANVFSGLNKLDRLLLQNNRLTTVPANVFAGLGKLTDLSLGSNSLTTLPANAFAGLDKLTSLGLSRNRLTSLPANAFAGLGELTSLDLGVNQLTTLPANVFAGLGELISLSLGNNRLTTLPANVFAGLGELTSLSLGNNRLTTLPENVFAGLGKLRWLRLYNNPQLTTLPVGAFNGLTPGLVRISGIAGLPSPPAALRFTPRNQALQVRWNAAANTHYQLRWKAAAATTFAADDAAATSTYSHTITGLQNGAEYEVQVAAVPAAPTSTTSTLPVTWQSRNGRATPSWNLRLESRFESLRATWDEPASGSADSYKIRWKAAGASEYSEAASATTSHTITGLQNGAIYSVQVAAVNGDFTGDFSAAARAAPRVPSVCDRTAQVRAEILKHVGGGKTCATVTAQDLAGFRTLNLSRESITTLKSGDFAGLANVTRLWLTNNHLTTLPTNAFSGLGELITLSLNNNQLTSLPANVFAGLNKLTSLHLSSNRLTTLPANVFAGLDKLTYLELGGNQLTTLPANAFAGLDKLTSLNLRDNQLNTLPANALAGLGKLTGLDLSGNQPLTLPANAFAGLEKLTRLGLGDNQLTSLPANVFAGLGELTELELQNNRLTSLPANAFAGLGELTELELHKNRLTTLPENVFAGLGKLRWLRLYNNPQLTTLPAGAFNGLTPGLVRISGIAGLPSPPAALRFTPRNRALQVQWDAAANTHYQLRWKAAAATTFAADDAAATSTYSHTITGLQNGAEYEVQVAAVPAAPTNTSSSTTHLWSSRSGSATPASAVPGAPQTPAVTPGNGELAVTWAAPAADGGDAVATYRLRWKAADETEFADADAATVDAPALTAAITGLSNGRTYDVEIAAGNSAGFGDAATTQGTPRAVPGAPQTPAVTPGNGELAVTWAAPAADGGDAVATYRLRWKAADETEFADADAATVDAPALTAAITGLSNGRTYDVEIAAGNSAGFGDAATTQGTPRTVPGAPQTPAATPGNGELAVTWAAPAADGGDAVATYRLRWKAADETEFADADAATVDAPALTAAITGLSNGRTYDVEIAAGNSAGFGDAATTQGTPRAVPGAPQTPAVTPGNGELAVTWAAPAADGGDAVATYRLRWKAADETEFADADAATVDAPALTATITGLSNGRTYDVEIAAGNSAGFGDAATTQGTPRAVPGAPQTPAVTPGNGELAVTWAAPAADGGDAVATYRLRWKAADETEFADADAATVDAPALTAAITGLSNGRTYDVEIAAGNSAGFGDAATTQGTPRTVPGAPQTPAATPGNGELAVTWAAPAADGGDAVATYRLRWKAADETEFADADAATVDAPALTATITGLSNGRTYDVEIAAGNSAGFGDAATTQGTPRAVPGAPQTPAVTPGNGELAVTWAAPAADGGDAVATYRLRWKAADETEFADADAATVDAPALTAAITGLSNGRTYDVEIAAGNSAGFGDAATAQGTPRTVPGAPQTPAATPGNGELAVTWAAPAADGGDAVATYRLRWKAADETEFADADAATVDAPALTAAITGLSNGRTYDVEIAAGNSAGFGDAATTQGTPRTVPGAPQTPAVTPGNGELAVTWAAPAADGGDAVATYRLRWKAADETEFADADAATVDAPALTAAITGLSNGRTYDVEIAAGNSAGFGDAATTQGTPRTVPGAPQTPAATPGNGELAVTWAAPAADGGDAVATYRLRWKAADETEFADADAATVDAPALTATITGLSNGRTYDVEIAAGNSAGFGDAATAQGTPSWNLRLESRFESLRATWDAPASGTAASYKIRWKTAGASEYSEAESATTSHTITGLQTGIIYEVQVAPVDANKIVGDFSTVARAAPVALWPPVCDRTEQVRDAIVKEVGGGKTCSRVTTQDLAGISGWFRLSSKSITALKSGDFNGLVNVTTLLLSNNDLTTLPANAFAGLEKLTDLYLSDNQLTTLPANAFAGLGELDTLRLEENELTMLPANVFAGLGKLRFLTLSGNQLTALQANLLAGLGELGWLSLNENQLTTLPANLFAGLGELLSLSLHGNQLTTLPVGAFNGLTPGWVGVSGIELPSPPAALTFTPRNRALRVQWDAAANTHYQLRWKAVSATTFAADDAAATSTYIHTITGLQNGAEYEVRVAAFPAAPTNTDSETPVTWRSRSGRATPVAAPPGMPRNLRLESRAAASLHAAWDAPAAGAADSYKIRWKAAGTSQYSDAAPAAAAYTITGLQNGATYEVQVAAVNGDFTGDFGAAAKGVPFTVPGAPQLLGTAAGDQTLLAMWNPPASNGGAGITTYLLRWKPESETNYDPAKSATAGANAREHRINGLQNCGEYTLEIAAENARGPGPWASKTVAPNNWGSAALTAAEGILIARRALGVTDAESLKYGQTGEADADLMPRLNCIVDYKVIDADNDGDVDGIDGILFLRYVLGLRGAALVESYDVDADAVEAVFQLLP